MTCALPETWKIETGDCLALMRDLADNSIDAIVTDPPYEIGFMGRAWDSTGIAYDPATWAECLRVLKPGGHLLAFAATRTYHRIAVAIEDAGFEIRDMVEWIYGQGFPKSLDVSKAINKALGAERAPDVMDGRQGVETNTAFGAGLGVGIVERAPAASTEAAEWDGWGTALKPAHEPIVLARKPLTGTVAQNVLDHGTGALNIDGCRVRLGERDRFEYGRDRNLEHHGSVAMGEFAEVTPYTPHDEGRWPANVVLSKTAAEDLDAAQPATKSRKGKPRAAAQPSPGWGMKNVGAEYDDEGGPSRFFYVAKPNKRERSAGLGGPNVHPTVKPIELMRHLCRLVTPTGGIVLDPFAGSGSTGCGAVLDGFRFLGLELLDDHAEIARARIAYHADTVEAEAADEQPAEVVEQPSLFNLDERTAA